MKLNLNDPIELIEARKSSPDWHGISVIFGLMKFGPLALNVDRDRARIDAMTPERKAKVNDFIQRFVALEKDVDALHEEINNELRLTINGEA